MLQELDLGDDTTDRGNGRSNGGFSRGEKGVDARGDRGSGAGAKGGEGEEDDNNVDSGLDDLLDLMDSAGESK